MALSKDCIAEEDSQLHDDLLGSYYEHGADTWGDKPDASEQAPSSAWDEARAHLLTSCARFELERLGYHQEYGGFCNVAQLNACVQVRWQTSGRLRRRSPRRSWRLASQRSPVDWALLLLPCLAWLRGYRVRDWLIHDLLAGLSVAAMAIPQAVAYASLAGLPSALGLYAAAWAPLGYALFGSSSKLAVGPVAITYTILGGALPDIMDQLGLPVNWHPNHPAHPAAQAVYNQAACQIALLAGGIYFLVALLRLGWTANLLSPSAVSGFTTGASIHIAASQVRAGVPSLHDTGEGLGGGGGGKGAWGPPCLLHPASPRSCWCSGILAAAETLLPACGAFPFPTQTPPRINDNTTTKNGVQLKLIMGVRLPRAQSTLQQLINLFKARHGIS